MSRPEFLIPDGEITPQLLADVLALIGADWHLRASGNLVRRRPRPWLLSAEAGQ